MKSTGISRLPKKPSIYTKASDNINNSQITKKTINVIIILNFKLIIVRLNNFL